MLNIPFQMTETNHNTIYNTILNDLITGSLPWYHSISPIKTESQAKTQNLCGVRKKIQHLPRLHSVSTQRVIAAQSAGEFTPLHRHATFFAKRVVVAEGEIKGILPNLGPTCTPGLL